MVLSTRCCYYFRVGIYDLYSCLFGAAMFISHYMFFLLLFTRCCYCSVVTVSVEVTTSGLCCSFLCRFVGEGGPQNSHRSPSTNDDSSWSVYHQVYAELVYCWINKLHCESCGPLTSMYEDFLLECMKEFVCYDSHSDIYTVVDIIAHLPALNHVRSLSLIDAVLPLAWHMHVPTMCLHVMAEFTYKLNRYVKKELFDLAGQDTFVEKYTYQMSVLRTNFICPPFLSFLFFS